MIAYEPHTCHTQIVTISRFLQLAVFGGTISRLNTPKFLTSVVLKYDSLSFDTTLLTKALQITKKKFIFTLKVMSENTFSMGLYEQNTCSSYGISLSFQRILQILNACYAFKRENASQVRSRNQPYIPMDISVLDFLANILYLEELCIFVTEISTLVVVSETSFRLQFPCIPEIELLFTMKTTTVSEFSRVAKLLRRKEFWKLRRGLYSHAKGCVEVAYATRRQLVVVDVVAELSERVLQLQPQPFPSLTVEDVTTCAHRKSTDVIEDSVENIVENVVHYLVNLVELKFRNSSIEVLSTEKSEILIAGEKIVLQRGVKVPVLRSSFFSTFYESFLFFLPLFSSYFNQLCLFMGPYFEYL